MLRGVRGGLLAVVGAVCVACVVGCGGEDVSTIDARLDAGEALPMDGGVVERDAGPGPGRDAGVPGDAGPGTDGACTPMPPPPPPAWVPVDTGGPAGESLSACIARVGARTDNRLPADQGYDLTTFGGPGDVQPVSCAGAATADGTWFYAANAQRFTCGQRVRITDEARTHCVIAQVADIGPNACVEEAGGRAIWDMSPLAAQELYGVSSVGWSEHRAVRGAPVDASNPLGVCDHLADPAAFLRGWVGAPCTSAADCTFAGAVCRTPAEGYPGGHCTQTCTTTCPDRAGPNAYTACANVPGDTTECIARCDFTLFASGCRDGYGCVANAHPTTGTMRWVCLPIACG